jgi:hypothetical protein
MNSGKWKTGNKPLVELTAIAGTDGSLLSQEGFRGTYLTGKRAGVKLFKLKINCDSFYYTN